MGGKDSESLSDDGIVVETLANARTQTVPRNIAHGQTSDGTRRDETVS